MAVTIKNVAKAANVSIATASLILNQKEGAIRFSEATIQRVKEKALELGYVPNMSARKLRQNENDGAALTLAVLWPIDTRVGLIGRLLNGIHQYTTEFDTVKINLLVRTMGDDGVREVKELYAANLFNGAILANTTVDDEAYIHQFPPSVPIVLFNRFSPIYPFVSVDNFGAAKKVAEHFVKNGHSSVVVLASAISSQALEDRLAGFMDGLQGLDHVVVRCECTEASGYVVVAKMLAAGQRPTGLISVWDQTAMGALSALNDFGVKVPAECEVSGFDNQVYSSFTIPKLSTVNVPVEKMAFQAMKFLVQESMDPLNTEKNMMFGLDIIHRGTTKY